MAEYAVLIPWVTTEDGDCILLEVRSDKVKQPGEVCFPGGRNEPGETIGETAVRETCEELGIRPEEIEVIAAPQMEVMADNRRVWSLEAKLHIEGIERLVLSEDEVADVFLLPAGWLNSCPPDHYDLSTTEDDELPDKLREYLSRYGEFRRIGSTDYWEYEGHGIWGLTARIIKNIINMQG